MCIRDSFQTYSRISPQHRFFKFITIQKHFYIIKFRPFFSLFIFCLLYTSIVDCGLWYLAEYEGPQTLAEQAAAGEPAAQGEQATKGAPAIQQDAASGGRFTLNRNPRELSSVEAYFRRQGRFKQLADEDVAAITAARDAKWAAMRRDWT